MQLAKEISSLIDQKAALFSAVSDEVWSHPELGFHEVQSAKALSTLLQSEGFAVEMGVAGIPTAFIATYGSGKPAVGFLGEYDALSLLSQQAGGTQHCPIEPGGNGHGCGHNALGAGSLAAAVAVKDYLQAHHLPGTVQYFGCPGEEFGSGKMFMARAGCFDNLDAAFTWHPGGFNGVKGSSTLACISVMFHFKGRTAHAAAAPHLGRSALDAVELTNVGVNYLREHIPTDHRMHYAYRDAGGLSPNVVQDQACVHYFVRAPRVKQCLALLERVQNVARGAALMTDTQLTIEINEGLCDYVPNDVLSRLLHECFVQTGAPAFDEKDIALAKQFHYSEAEVDAFIQKIDVNFGAQYGKEARQKVLCDTVFPYRMVDYHEPGSTDVGDVSYATPTAQLTATCWSVGTPGHSWQVTSMSGSSIAHKGLLAAGKAMALAAVRAMQDPDLLQRAQQEYRETTGGTYICPVPDDVKPELI